jgi:hypothetical protein
MHLTPIERLKVIDIYFSLARSRSVNRAKTTSRIAAEQQIFISDKSVKNIVRKWLITSNISSC